MSKRTIKFVFLFGVLFALGAILVACQGATQVAAPTSAPAPTQACPTCPTCPEAPACPTAAPAMVAPHEDEWKASPHNDATAAAFTDWNDSADKMVPAGCAQCHSTTGYIDYVGGDGSAAGKVDQPAPIGTTVTCDACHNAAAAALTSVTFPSGAVISGLGAEARCMVCHQGRTSGATVDAQVAKFKVEDPDRVPMPITSGDTTTSFGFINIHYAAAAATMYGSEAHAGYEYPGKAYDVKFDHTEGYDTCVACHDSHTTQVKVEQCAMCHTNVKTVEDLKNVREYGSSSDYDGDGNVTEGMADEIKGLQDSLYATIQNYAKEFQGSGLLYDPATYPYWFNDRDGDGKPDQTDKGANQSYNTWTPRLLKAAYNLQMSVKDPGAFAHGNKYIVELLYDSIEDLNASAMVTKTDVSKMHREDAGHFAGDSAAFRHWDGEEMTVAAGCAKCHAAGGLPQFIKDGTNVSMPASNGFQCSTCHDEANWPANYKVADVTFPSGAKVTFGDGAAANICLECHQGRESNASVAKALAGKPANTVDPKISFRNVHYFAAGATLFGHDVQGMVEYGGEYVGKFAHTNGLDTCTSCHDAHALAPKLETCVSCHPGADTADKIRAASDTTDWNGNSDTTEGIKAEVDAFAVRLYQAMQTYATTKSKGILYDGAAYPYFFLDANGDGKPDVDDKGASIAYSGNFTPELAKAAYNYQYYQKDPGAAMHNAKYVMQVLFDTIKDLGGDTKGLTRP
jgi:hypothetical protein